MTQVVFGLRGQRPSPMIKTSPTGSGERLIISKREKKISAGGKESPPAAGENTESPRRHKPEGLQIIGGKRALFPPTIFSRNGLKRVPEANLTLSVFPDGPSAELDARQSKY